MKKLLSYQNPFLSVSKCFPQILMCHQHLLHDHRDVVAPFHPALTLSHMSPKDSSPSWGSTHRQDSKLSFCAGDQTPACVTIVLYDCPQPHLQNHSSNCRGDCEATRSTFLTSDF